MLHTMVFILNSFSEVAVCRTAMTRTPDVQAQPVRHKTICLRIERRLVCGVATRDGSFQPGQRPEIQLREGAESMSPAHQRQRMPKQQ